MIQKRAELKHAEVERDEVKKPLMALLKQCRQYENDFPIYNNGGNLLRLRMPVSRSGCYPHAAGFPRRDDS